MCELRKVSGMHRVRLLRMAALYTVSIGLLVSLARCGRTDHPVASGAGDNAKPAEIQPPPSDWSVFTKTVQPFLTKNCASCHGGEQPEAGVRLEGFADSAEIVKRGHILTKALRQLRQHKMP